MAVNKLPLIQPLHERHAIRPAFLMPYFIGKTDEVEKTLYLRQFDVPFEVLAYITTTGCRTCSSLPRSTADEHQHNPVESAFSE